MRTQPIADEETLRLELQEALATFRHWSTQLTQAFGIIATGDALLITYGFAQRLAAIIFVASTLPIGALEIYLQVSGASAPLICLAIRIERKLSFRDSLAVTYAKTHLRPLISSPESLDSLDDEALMRLGENVPRRRWLLKKLPIVLYVATAAQIGLAILSLTFYHYKFL